MSKRIKKKSKLPQILGFLFLVFVVAASLVLVRLYERERPDFTLLTDISYLGIDGDVKFSVRDVKSGVRSIDISLVQGSKKVKLYSKKLPRQGYLLGFGPHHVEDSFGVQAKALGYDDGRADLQITVHDYSWWGWMTGNITDLTYSLIIDTKPPQVNILHSPRYIKPGGAGIVIYKISEPVSEHGVTVNGYFYPGFRLENRAEGTYVAYLGIPYDTERFEASFVSGTDKAGNGAKAVFGMILRRIVTEKDRISLDDGFLNSKLPEFQQHYPEITGTLEEQYLFVNSTIRSRNAEQIRKITMESQPERLWKGAFQRLPRSSRRAGFADFRSYYYSERNIDQQYHLGIDLASVRNASVIAANRGKVAFAGYIGIYGNTVMLDHGQGVFSLYSHLSQIDVEPDRIVDAGTVVGLTGTSGMAGGDHLHFSMLVNGVFVNPLEWWDASWLDLNIEGYL